MFVSAEMHSWRIAPAANPPCYCLVFRLQDGRIKEIREYCDSILTEKALGPFPEGRQAASG